jgi:hypothetical protein
MEKMVSPVPLASPEKMGKLGHLDRQVWKGRMVRTDLLELRAVLVNKVPPDRLARRVFAGLPEKRDLVDHLVKRDRKARLGKLELQDKTGNPGRQDLRALQVLQGNPRNTKDRKRPTLLPPNLISTDIDHIIAPLRPPTAPPTATARTEIARRNLIAVRKGSTEDESPRRRVITRVQEMIQIRIPMQMHITDERAKSTHIIVHDARKTHLTAPTGRGRTVTSPPRPRVLERIGLKDTARLTGI